MSSINDKHSLSHTKWNCKYHIVFAPKYRRKEFYGSKRLEIGQILRELCSWKEVNIIEAEVCPDHIHMLVEIPPKLSISSFMGFLKGKSSIMIEEIQIYDGKTEKDTWIKSVVFKLPLIDYDIDF